MAPTSWELFAGPPYGMDDVASLTQESEASGRKLTPADFRRIRTLGTGKSRRARIRRWNGWLTLAKDLLEGSVLFGRQVPQSPTGTKCTR